MDNLRLAPTSRLYGSTGVAVKSDPAIRTKHRRAIHQELHGMDDRIWIPFPDYFELLDRVGWTVEDYLEYVEYWEESNEE